MSKLYFWATASMAVTLIICSKSVFSAKITDLMENKIFFLDDALYLKFSQTVEKVLIHLKESHISLLTIKFMKPPHIFLFTNNYHAES